MPIIKLPLKDGKILKVDIDYCHYEETASLLNNGIYGVSEDIETLASFICVGHTYSDEACPNTPGFLLDNKPLCTIHLPYKEKQEFLQIIRPVKIDSEALKRQRKLEEIFSSRYQLLEICRKNPPSEITGSLLLRWIHKDRCYGCNTDRSRLVEDHDHKTGMVRAYLCFSCNTLEGKSDDLIWNLYRKYAPGNGLFIRYKGVGAQWKCGWPDPFPKRLLGQTEKNSDSLRLLIEAEEKLNKDEMPVQVKEYLELAEAMPATKIPKTAYREFNIYNQPIPFEDEKYLELEDRKSENGYWPIEVSDDKNHKVSVSAYPKEKTVFDDPIQRKIGAVFKKMLKELKEEE